MTGQILNTLGRRIKPFWLTGPIFEKELVVSSRRLRNYILRFVYIGFLCFFVISTWFALVSFYGNAAYRTAQMSVAGRTIVTTVSFYQFIMTQFVAVVLLSTAISDEINHKTLGLLMTTPITSFQIVMGKLLSKLLQMLLLIGVSLPLLVIIRVFGGIPWSYVLSSFCITMTASIFAGALTLYFSIKGRYAYAVILKSIFTLAGLYLFIPMIVYFSMFLFYRYPGSLITGKLLYLLTAFNPFIQMSITTTSMMTAGAGGLGGMSVAPWPIHCLVMTGLTVLLVARSVLIVRRVALSQAAGAYEVAPRFRKKRKRAQASSTATAVRHISDDAIRPVRGSPIIWKELRVPFLTGGRRSAKIAIAFSITALFLCYFLNYMMDALSDEVAHVGYAFVFVLLGLITNTVLSSTTITGEKESGAWPILLTTPLDDWQIITGKAVGVFRRCLPIWFFLTGHLLLFIFVGYIHPAAFFQMALVVTGAIVFLGCSGLYFSSVMRRTTSAVVANFGFIAVLWIFIPIFLGYATALTKSNPKFLNAYLSANPLTQTVVVMSACSGSGNAGGPLSKLDYKWPTNRNNDFAGATVIILITTISYVFFGLLLLHRARMRIRRKIF